MLIGIYNPWFRTLRWNIFLIFGFCTQDALAATDSMELAGIVAAGIIGLFLLTSAFIAMIFFCKKIKESRQKEIRKGLEKKRLHQYRSGSMLNQPIIIDPEPNVANEDIYMDPMNDIHNMNPNPIYTFSQSQTGYERKLSIHSKDSHSKEFDRNNERIRDLSTSQLLNPSTLQTRAMVHEMYDHNMRQPDRRELAASRADSEFILKKREDNLSDRGKNNSNAFRGLSATEFMLDRKRERSPQRSDLRYISNDYNNASSLKNGGRFLTVGDSQQDKHPLPDYDVNTGGESGKVGTTNSYEMDLREIKKDFPFDALGRSYESNWDDTYSKSRF